MTRYFMAISGNVFTEEQLISTFGEIPDCLIDDEIPLFREVRPIVENPNPCISSDWEEIE